MWVGDFHPINFDEDEVVQLFCHNAGVELCDCFSDRSCLAGAGCTRYVNACARAGGDGGFEMSVDRAEFMVAARQYVGDGGDV